MPPLIAAALSLMSAMIAAPDKALTSLSDEDAKGKARVTFVVTVPKDTPGDARVYICGSPPALGSWTPPGLALKRTTGDRYEGAAELSVGDAIEFKATLGSWTSVEKSGEGGDIANRSHRISGNDRIELTVARWASMTIEPQSASTPKKPSTSVTGDVRNHKDFASRFLGNTRTIAVYLPPDYKKDEKRRYSVLYMHDGQNLFDALTSFIGVEWQADEHAERLIQAGKIEPIIIVGLYNTPARMEEYTPDRDEGRKAGGRGDVYAKFLVEEVKPFIDKTYRTKPDRANTGMAGSSLGGLISLHICHKYPKTFSRCGIISPALMWNDRSILKSLEADHDWMKGTRFWLDMGTEEGRQVAGFGEAMTDTRRLAKIFDAAGLRKDRDYRYLEVSGGQHNETAWAARFDQLLLFFFPT